MQGILKKFNKQFDCKVPAGGLPDCNECFWLKGDMCVIPFGPVESWKASECNIISKHVNFIDETYLRSSCEQFTTPTIGQKILSGEVIRCRDCIHYENVRGFHVCFVEGIPAGCHQGLQNGFDKENPDRKPSKNSADNWNVCLDYEEPQKT